MAKDIWRATRRHFFAENKVRIVLDGQRGEDSIAEICRKEGIAQSLYNVWSREFLETRKRRLSGDTARAATTDEVKTLRREVVNRHRVWTPIGVVKNCSHLESRDRYLTLRTFLGEDLAIVSHEHGYANWSPLRADSIEEGSRGEIP